MKVSKWVRKRSVKTQTLGWEIKCLEIYTVSDETHPMQ